MLSLKRQAVGQEEATPQWSIGIDRRQVAAYVVVALAVGFISGFVTSRYLSRQDDEPRDLLRAREERAAVEPEQTEMTISASGVVTRVERADIIEVAGIGSVRMIGVETPDGKAPDEIYGQHGRQARAFTQAMLLNQNVRLAYDSTYGGPGNKGEDGQILAYVYTPDGTLFNGELVRQGHALVHVSEQFHYIDEFRSQEREAMQAMRGVWGLSSSTTEAPDQRQLDARPTEPKPGSSTGNGSKKLAPMHPSEIGPNIPAISGSSTPPSSSEPAVFVSAPDRMYHKSGCDYLGKKRRGISIPQARAEGYTACGRCYASTVLRAP